MENHAKVTNAPVKTSTSRGLSRPPAPPQAVPPRDAAFPLTCLASRTTWLPSTEEERFASIAILKQELSTCIENGLGEVILELGYGADGKLLNFTRDEFDAAMGLLEEVVSQCDAVVRRLTSIPHGRNFCFDFEEAANLVNPPIPKANLTSQLLTNSPSVAQNNFGLAVSAEKPATASYVLIRRKPTCIEDLLLELRMVVCGNVDSGKSTLLGVLTHVALDDSRGHSRRVLFRHKHEVETGRTSSVGTEALIYDAMGNFLLPPNIKRLPAPSQAHAEALKEFNSLIALEDEKEALVRIPNQHAPPHSAGTASTGSTALARSGGGAAGASAVSSTDAVSRNAAKIIALMDLAGHEKYLKTTIFGLCGTCADFAMLVVGANNGFIGMSREHMLLMASVTLPMTVVVTKIDSCPPEILLQTLRAISRAVKSGAIKKTPVFVRDKADAVKIARVFQVEKHVPVFLVSNVTGAGLDNLRGFLNLLPVSRARFDKEKPAEFQILRTCVVDGTGLVLQGTVQAGVVRVGQRMRLGPTSTGEFLQAQVRGIHQESCAVGAAFAGRCATLAVKRVKRQQITKGMVLYEGVGGAPPICLEFLADVLILTHSSTISNKYQATLHCGTVQQTVSIVSMQGREVMRAGERCNVRFRFMYRPERIAENNRFIMREGRARGVGRVVKIFPCTETEVSAYQQAQRTRKTRHRNKESVKASS